jgi:hypothetical protein
MVGIGLIENLKPFSKDYQPANPGRKKGVKPMSTILANMLNVAIKNPKLLDQYQILFPEYFKEGEKTKTPRELIMLRLMTKALEGDLKAMDMVLDRTEGKVKNEIELSGEVGGKTDLSTIPLEELKQIEGILDKHNP